jgi:hypothetical protein
MKGGAMEWFDGHVGRSKEGSEARAHRIYRLRSYLSVGAT